MSRPTVNIFKVEFSKDGAEAKTTGQTVTPKIMMSPLRYDIVKRVHADMSKNRMQPQGVKIEAGYDFSATSWGTGRAVARIPRVQGGGTHRSGQGAFGNMCRGGGMAHPLKANRRIHRRINLKMKRFARAAALSAARFPPLVAARGHRIDEIPELPLVFNGDCVTDKKINFNTKKAVQLLEALGCGAELDKAKNTRKVRAGKGKYRNRRYVNRKGPLIIYDDEVQLYKATRRITGVDTCNVNRLNVLQLAPGGNVGRLMIFTESAFKKLDSTFVFANGWYKTFFKKHPMMKVQEVATIASREVVQKAINPKLTPPPQYPKKMSSLNKRELLNPYLAVKRQLPPAPAEANTRTRPNKAAKRELKNVFGVAQLKRTIEEPEKADAKEEEDE